MYNCALLMTEIIDGDFCNDLLIEMEHNVFSSFLKDEEKEHKEKLISPR